MISAVFQKCVTRSVATHRTLRRTRRAGRPGLRLRARTPDPCVAEPDSALTEADVSSEQANLLAGISAVAARIQRNRNVLVAVLAPLRDTSDTEEHRRQAAE